MPVRIREEDFVKIIRWKLGLPGGGENLADVQQKWAELQKNPAEYKHVVEQVSLRLGHLLAAALRAKITGEPSANFAWSSELSDLFVKWAKDNERAVSPKLSGTILAAVKGKAPPTQARPAPPMVRPIPKKPTGLHPQAGQSPTPPPLPPPLPTRLAIPNEQPPPLPSVDPPPMLEVIEPIAPAPTDWDPNVSEQQAGSPPPSMWQYKGLPNDPEQHTEHDARAMANPPEGFKVFGARVRGKKHKHDGTNCDDWFEFGQSGPWTVIAVADGAGSYKFSRIGAKVACETAVKELAADLGKVSLERRDTVAEWAAAQAQSPIHYQFAGRDIQDVQKAMYRAVRKAFQAVKTAHEERSGSPEYEACLPPNRRPLDIKEFSSTLLLAVHHAVRVDGKDWSFVMACQVGDGMTGAIHKHGTAHPLGTADSGSYSGETEFLTSSGKTDEPYLAKKIHAFLGPVQAIVVMTDGVADDYFPGTEHLGRLWGDLVVNRIPEVIVPGDEEIANAISGTGLPTLDELKAANIGVSAEVIDGRTPRNTVHLKSSEDYAEKLQISVEALLKHPTVLLAGTQTPGKLEGATSEDRLRVWLDAYHVRGSFDDRTLVVMHREALP